MHIIGQDYEAYGGHKVTSCTLSRCTQAKEEAGKYQSLNACSTIDFFSLKRRGTKRLNVTI